MKTTFKFASATLFVLALLGNSQIASATDTSQAIKLCDANPSCTMKWGKLNDAITIVIGGKVIDCPKKNGPCTAVRIGRANLNEIGQGHSNEFKQQSTETRSEPVVGGAVFQ